MEVRINSIAVNSLASRLEYCLQNMEMRLAIKRILKFISFETKVEAVEYMAEIQAKRLVF